MTLAQIDSAAVESHDTFPINGTDYIEFYVGNAKQAAHYYESAFGFRLVAYRGPETGVRDRASYLLMQNKIRLMLTTPLGPEGEVAQHVHAHGDGVHDIALWVDDARDAYAKAIERGAKSEYEPRVLQDPDARNLGRSAFGESHYLDDATGDRVYSMRHIEAELSAFGEACRGCAAVRRCPGIAHAYAQRYGVEELVPFPPPASAV